MLTTATPRVGSLLTGALAVLTARPIFAAEVCSAWAEPARIAVQTQLRKEHRLRTDEPWVLEVARNPRAIVGYADIRMSPEEQAEFQARFAKLSVDEAQRGVTIRQAMAYAERYPEQFAGSYLRRSSDYFFDPPDAFVIKFTGNLAAHEAALAALPAGSIPLEILPARFSMQQLKTVQQTLDGRYLNPPASGIRFIGSGPDLNNNVVQIRVESDLPDAAARVEAGFDGAVKATVYPVRDDSKRIPVTQGTGWRLLGRSVHRGGQPEEETTRLASSEAEWQALRSTTELSEPLSRVDFRKEIVLTVTSSLGCGELRLDDIVIDQPLQSITPKFSRAGSAYGACGAAYVGYEVFAVAIERTALPPNPITVPQARPSWEMLQDPAYCPSGLVIRGR